MLLKNFIDLLVVLGLIERLDDLLINFTPVFGERVDLLIEDLNRSIHRITTSLGKIFFKGAVALVGYMRHQDKQQFYHALSQVLGINDRAIICIVAKKCLGVHYLGVDSFFLPDEGGA